MFKSQTTISKIIREQTAVSLIDLISPDRFDAGNRTGNGTGTGTSSVIRKTYRIPEHQRFPSWSNASKTRLVDSIMSNFPIGQITLTKHVDYEQDNEEYFNVQDGQTRMTVLQEFVLGKFPWETKLYDELTADERARFNNYIVQTDIFKKDRATSPMEFNAVICEVFERLNSGKPLTDNDKYWNRQDTPAIQFLKRLRDSAEFGPPIRKYMWSNLAGGKTRSGLNHFIGLILGIVNQRAECISTSFMQNGEILLATVINADAEKRMTDFLRWYFGILTDVFQFAQWTVKRTFGKLSGVCGLVAVDWINSPAGARSHYEMWKKYIDLQYSREHFERRVFEKLSNGNARNVTELAINARIAAVCALYQENQFSEYETDLFKLILQNNGSDDDDDYE